MREAGEASAYAWHTAAWHTDSTQGLAGSAWSQAGSRVHRVGLTRSFALGARLPGVRGNAGCWAQVLQRTGREYSYRLELDSEPRALPRAVTHGPGDLTRVMAQEGEAAVQLA